MRAVASYSPAAPLFCHIAWVLLRMCHLIGEERENMSRSSLNASLKAKIIFVPYFSSRECSFPNILDVTTSLFKGQSSDENQNGLSILTGIHWTSLSWWRRHILFAFSIGKRWKKLCGAVHWHERGTNCTLSEMHWTPFFVCQSIGQRTGYQTNHQRWW